MVMEPPDVRRLLSDDLAAVRELERAVRAYIQAFILEAPPWAEWQNDGLWAHVELEAADIFGIDLARVHTIASTVRYHTKG